MVLHGPDHMPTTQVNLLESFAYNEAVKEQLYLLYWRPLCSFLIRKGYRQEDAEDYTQAFLTDILYGKNVIGRYDRNKGSKFRSYLISSFSHYIIDLQRKRREKTLPCDEDGRVQIDSTVTDDPMHAFDLEWATGILQRAIHDVKTQCVQNGLKVHWTLYTERILIPNLERLPQPSLSELGAKYGIDSPQKIANMLVAVKRRFQNTIMRHLTNYTGSESDSEEELAYFFELFAKGMNTQEQDIELDEQDTRTNHIGSSLLAALALV